MLSLESKLIPTLGGFSLLDNAPNNLQLTNII